MRIIECVPNISEGRNKKIIDAIVDMAAKTGVKILDVDMGYDANRTVLTMAGTPEQIIKAAYSVIYAAHKLIDMTQHKGTHPRLGAVDVCPFIPLEGATMSDCIKIARHLGQKVAKNFGIPVYLYENAASNPKRRDLAYIRKGQYESLEQKLKELHPDFGPVEMNDVVRHSGAITIGARKLLLAYNISLSTDDVKHASYIAKRIRESGDKHKLKGVKAIGWFLPQYKFAQVSCNITDFNITPLHKVFDTCKEEAQDLGLEIEESEIVGLIPRDAIMAAADFYSSSYCGGLPEEEMLQIAIKVMRLDMRKNFDPAKKILENRLKNPIK
ncbi:glutamate formiminotransferase [Elusimicrobium simillimum]|uniref:glutamate formimidoyltransferase n=1 Tax=Elusimicrobium simillimum TaxID=3143438 RepID=UPI003C6F1848